MLSALFPLARRAFAGVTLAAAVVVVGAGCSTLNEARPLEPGQHALAATVGGPLLDVPGVGKIPMPHVTLEGRHGVAHHFDVGYGVHLLPLAFGVLGAHVGAAYQLNDQPDPFGPALTVSEKLYGFTNVLQGDALSGNKPLDFWGMSQTDLTASWKVFGDQLFYGGGTLYAVANDGKLFLAPFAGVQIDPGLDWLRVQVEGKWLAPYINQRFAVVNWIAPGDQGAIVINAGVAFVFGGAPAKGGAR